MSVTRVDWQEWLYASRRPGVVLLWSCLEQAAGRDLTPDVAGGEPPAFLATFDQGPHHLEVELGEVTEEGEAPDTWEWFYRNRETEELDGEEGIDLASVPPAFLDRLSLFKEPK